MRGPVRAVDAAATGDEPSDVPSPSDPTSADASEPAGYTIRLTMTRHPEAEPVNPHGLGTSGRGRTGANQGGYQERS